MNTRRNITRNEYKFLSLDEIKEYHKYLNRDCTGRIIWKPNDKLKFVSKEPSVALQKIIFSFTHAFTYYDLLKYPINQKLYDQYREHRETYDDFVKRVDQAKSNLLQLASTIYTKENIMF